jgi:hypothetical protein
MSIVRCDLGIASDRFILHSTAENDVIRGFSKEP